MTFEPSGAIIASPTTSLPEVLGGERNWDYRFTWIRDSTFTLQALLRLGYTGEARDFISFILSICKFHEHQPNEIQIMYGINGEIDLKEEIVSSLEGYQKSTPVRVGNAAYKQEQLDIYGEVMDCIYLFYTVGGLGNKSEMMNNIWVMVEDIVEYTIAHWNEKDAGIWEFRGRKEHFLYSKVMCWVALDRGIKLARGLKQQDVIDDWQKTCEEIRNSILTQGFNTTVSAFTQAYGSSVLDAGALRLPLVEFLSVKDEKMKTTVEAIQKGLTHNGLVYRYLNANDGLPGQEATFSMCTFWLISCLTLMGKKKEAKAWFEKMISFANDVGLYAEELDAITGEQFGNFPQGFTHIALINTAYCMERNDENNSQRNLHR
jgi:GH15 family glucan-1,4-alpha-glucosidase